MTLINIKVSKVTQEADGIRSFTLTKSGLFKLPEYTPGSHIDVHCGEGIIRQYSLCGDPLDRKQYMIAVKQGEPSRGGSDLMHQAVKEGDWLEIGSPRNNFPLDETAEKAILLAAGIGITPIIAMADRLHALGRPFELHYFSRSPAHTAFRTRLASGAYPDKVTFHEGLDIPATGTALQDILAQPINGGQVYMCGPGPFMDTAEAEALKNWPADAINLERFAANPALAGAPTHEFKVNLVRTGVTLTVSKDQTILDVLEDNDIDAAFSCEQGVCGTCVTDIVEGDPDHRDSFLSGKQREAKKQICICVSRAKGDTLSIDL